MRSFPNILITGTPGVGKTTTCSALVASASASADGCLRCLSLNALAKEHDCYSGWDEDLQTHVLDEDKVLDEVERVMGIRGESNKDGGREEEEEEEVGGWVLDYHSAELFPRAWVDLVVVLRCEATEVLWDRLTAR
jgi:adenylate kinase